MLQRLLAWLTGKKSPAVEANQPQNPKARPGGKAGRSGNGTDLAPGERGAAKSKSGKPKRMKVKRKR